MEEWGAFFTRLQEISEPRDRLRTLLAHPDQEDARIRSAIAWWHARYRFADKKQTRAMDKFLWALLSLSSFAASQTSSGKKATAQAYTQALATPEADRAIQLEDRLYQECLEACALYIQTLSPQRAVFGISLRRELSKEEIYSRIAKTVAGGLMPGLWVCCGAMPRAGILMRALYEGANIVYPGIQSSLLERVQQCPDPACQEFIRLHIRPESL